uniref:Movement protein n=1 Tax=Chickpea yellow dwarf virus TaxID=1568974 RepID=A0A7S8F9B5_9GEMI|nr:movement protein [Chickpea yellow dwarf virus]
MLPAKYEVFPGENYSYTPTFAGSYQEVPTSHNSSGETFNKVFVALIVILISVGVCYLAYVLFVKDLILLLKAKKQRTTTEIGFGNTPGRPNSRRQEDAGTV